MLEGEFIKLDERFKFIWHTTWMEPCHKCQLLNERTWTGLDVQENVLYDAIWGNLWDVYADVPLTHPNCKCYLEVQYEASLEELLKVEPSIYEDFKIMTSNIKEMQEQLNDFDKDLARVSNRIDNNRAQLTTYLMLLQRLGLPPEAQRAINILVRVKMTAEMSARALYLLQAATLAGGPMAWGIALATMGVAVLGGTGILMDIGGT